MTLDELFALLRSTGIATTYYEWPKDEAPPLPWLCYLMTGSDNFAADGVVYHRALNVDVELYTEEKDPALEAEVETALDGAGIYWEKSETRIDAENLFCVTYEIEV